jgi:ParB/RepB/Spo0J family partition protein
MPEQILQISLNLLRVAATNTRKDTAAGQEDASIAGLAQSIKRDGLINPPTVRPIGDGTYEIIAGQRRYLACKELGLATIPVIVRDQVSDTSAVTLSLIENVQRADMHPLDKARAYADLKERHSGNLREVAEATGVTVATIQRYLDLLRLPAQLQEEVGTGQGAAGVGAMSAIARTFSDPDDMTEAWNRVGGFTQRIQAEILKRSEGDVSKLPDLVMQASEGAFDIKACGSGIHDCPHIPDELRTPLLQAVRALESGDQNAAKSLKDVAASHKKKSR